MKSGLSVFSSCSLLCYLHTIGSLGFSEFHHGTRKLYQVVHARFFWKYFFLCPKIGEMGQKQAKNRVF